jgi:pimeloyl-ACP methyl ester carboxylesterase
MQLNTQNVTGSLRSRDGSRIGFLTVGDGPGVIVIPGALTMASEFASFARTLGDEHFTVHTIERRGRGTSSPQGDDYSIVKEVEDVLALQEMTGARFLVGHSFGGLVALEAARRNSGLTKIAVYEPGVSIDGSISMSWTNAYETNLAQGKNLDAFIEFVRGLGPVSSRKTPRWLLKLLLPRFISSSDRQRMFSLLAENLREHQEVARLDNTYANYREISAGVLLMYGGKSGTGLVTLAERLQTVLAQAEIRGFARLDHFGIEQKPEEVVRPISDYFRT